MRIDHLSNACSLSSSLSLCAPSVRIKLIEAVDKFSTLVDYSLKNFEEIKNCEAAFLSCTRLAIRNGTGVFFLTRFVKNNGRGHRATAATQTQKAPAATADFPNNFTYDHAK